MPRLLTLLTCALLAPFAHAQPKTTPPAATGPTLTSPHFLGVKPGTTAEVILSGTNLTDVTQVWASFGGRWTVPDGQKDATKLTARVEVPKDAFGQYEIRVATKAGLTNARPISVDDFPEVKEADGNRVKSTPQTVPNPCVVVGQADAEASDFYRVPAKAGEPLTLEVFGRRLGSLLDPVILVHDEKGREMAGLYADDTPGLQTDARLTFTPKTTTDYVVEVRDTTYRGGPEYGYRLRVGGYTGATTAFPVAVQRGERADIRFTGPGTADALPVSLVATAPTAMLARPRFQAGGAGWPVPVLMADVPQFAEVEPNNTAATAQKLPLPCGVTGRFDTKNDLDCFRVAVVKGKKYAATAVTAAINSPAEVLVKVQDAKGGKLGESNPTQPVCKAEFTAAADGEVVVVCEHLNYLAGPNEVYWLQLSEVLPDFTVTLGADRFFVPQGGVGLIPVTGVTRLNGFAGPVTLSLFGAERFTGSWTLPTGVTPTPAAPVYLPVSVPAKTALGAGVVYFNGLATAGGKEFGRRASVADLVKASYNGLPNPPPVLRERVGIAVVPKGAFTLAVKLDKPEAVAGTTVKGTVSVTRAKDFAEEVTLTTVAAPANATLKLKPVAKDKDEAEFELVLPANAGVGPAQVIVKGTAKAGEAVALPVAFAVIEAAKKK